MTQKRFRKLMIGIMAGDRNTVNLIIKHNLATKREPYALIFSRFGCLYLVDHGYFDDYKALHAYMHLARVSYEKAFDDLQHARLIRYASQDENLTLELYKKVKENENGQR